jgi:protoporphyrinogen oxidase
MGARARRWGIVGGGFLGMTLAHRLAQAGHAVTLFEAAPHLGGLASAWSLGDVVWDRHYHVTLLSDSHIRGVLAELGLDGDMRWVETRTGFYSDGKLYSMSNSVEFLRFPPLGLVDKLRLGATIFHASRVTDWRRLESIPVAEWLGRLSGRRTLEKIWLPLLRSKLGDNYKKTSAAFIWATIQRLYAARRSGLKKEMFGYLPGGYARVLQRFDEALRKEGVDVRLGQPTKGVRAREAGLEVETAGSKDAFDRVVLTVPSLVAARVCEGLRAEETALLEGVQYQGIICASLLLRRPLAGFYVTNITDSWVPFTGVIEMSALVDRGQFAGHSLVYLPKYVDPGDPAFERSDAEIQEVFVSALERMYPGFGRDDIVSFRVSRVRHVFALPTIGYSRRLPPMDTSVPGLHVVNSTHIVNGTLNVNETVQLAEREAKRLMALDEAGIPATEAAPPRRVVA